MPCHSDSKTHSHHPGRYGHVRGHDIRRAVYHSISRREMAKADDSAVVHNLGHLFNCFKVFHRLAILNGMSVVIANYEMVPPLQPP